MNSVKNQIEERVRTARENLFRVIYRYGAAFLLLALEIGTVIQNRKIKIEGNEWLMPEDEEKPVGWGEDVEKRINKGISIPVS
jgi:hypothetical protein